MIYNIEIYFMLFIIYAFLGWVMECTLGLVQKHKFVNRGFLIGPYCPIYGVGVVGVTILLERFSYNIILLFIFSTILCGLLEYFTSYIMEKFFNARWWDYSTSRFNINGRVCLETLIPFGIISVLVIKFANPWILSKLYMISNTVLHYIVLSIVLLIIVDICISLNVVMKFKNMNKKEKDSTEEISKKVKETAEMIIQKLSSEKEKLTKEMNIRKYEISNNIKYTRKKYTNKIKNQQLTLVGNFKIKFNNLNEKIKEIDEKIKLSKKELQEKLDSIKEKQLNLTKEIKEKFSKQSKLNKRLISAFPKVEQRDFTRRKNRK